MNSTTQRNYINSVKFSIAESKTLGDRKVKTKYLMRKRMSIFAKSNLLISEINNLSSYEARDIQKNEIHYKT